MPLPPIEVNLGDLTKPINTLIKKLAKGLGGAFEPFQIVWIARAESQAAKIKAYSDAVISAANRWIL